MRAIDQYQTFLEINQDICWTSSTVSRLPAVSRFNICLPIRKLATEKKQTIFFYQHSMEGKVTWKISFGRDQLHPKIDMSSSDVSSVKVGAISCCQKRRSTLPFCLWWNHISRNGKEFKSSWAYELIYDITDPFLFASNKPKAKSSLN